MILRRLREPNRRPLACLLLATMLLAVSGANSAPPKVDPAVITKEITTQLASAEEAERKQALVAIQKMMEAEPARTVSQLRSYWMKPLLDARQFEDIIDLTTKGIFASAADAQSIEFLLASRIRAELSTGKSAQAMADAKSLYNVGTMAGMPATMLLVAECINTTHPDDASFVERFRAQQMAGAVFDGIIVVAQGYEGSTPTTRRAPLSATKGTDNGPPVLAAVKIETRAYDEAIAKLNAEDFQTLTAKGNLLLTADRIKEAKGVFDRAYGVVTEGYIATASESIARCIKAEDGAIGRANAWVISIRPKKDKPER